MSVWAPETIDPLLIALRQRREQLGLSQESVAVQIGTTQSNFSDWERGMYSPTLRTLRKWTAALDGGVRFAATESTITTIKIGVAA